MILFIYFVLARNIEMKIYKLLIITLKRKLNQRQFLLISSALVGLTAGLAAVSLKMLVYYLHYLLNKYLDSNSNNYLLLVLPILGIFITTIIVNSFWKDKFKKGVSSVLYVIAKQLAFIERSAMFSHVITSAITVSFGGSAGLEAPIVVTGSAIGSNYGRVNKLSYKERTLLIACGASAGIAAVFDAPIAGVMFAIEVLLTEMSISNFVLLIIAAVCGALSNQIILNEETLFFFKLKQPFNYINVPFYIVLGILTGLISLYYSRMTHKIEGFFRKLSMHPFARVFIGGIILGVLVFTFPPLFGEGYISIKDLANGNAQNILSNSGFSIFKHSEWILLLFIGLIAMVKVFATAITLNSGGNGGNFAPSLFVGAFTGFFFARFFNLVGMFQLPETNFTIVGMSGILSGVFYAPLTGIFLIAEITGGYELIIPLMIVSAIAFAIVKHFEPYSMDTSKLASEGNIFTHNRDKNILMQLNILEILETDFCTVPYNAKTSSMVNLITTSKRNIFPVLNDSGNLIGSIKLENIREILFDLENFNDIQVIELMNPPKCFIHVDDEMNSVMKKFDETGEWNLPVVDKDNKYLGFISKSRIFSKYRDKLISFTDEN